ncbi:hypothetical protein HWV62_185 [Athelia sp. TMB]|nr:hypothetical protein HWV62_185 [Athelia sp. TMB]
MIADDYHATGSLALANLARLNLPFPEAVFEINFFRRNPIPFYTLAKEMQPSQFRPTLTHSFIKLLADKQLLHVCLTQNIDTLERRAGVPPELIVEAHGSFATQRCIDCERPFDDEKMRHAVVNDDVPRCEDKTCQGLVKPDIVFFGEGAIPKLNDADLLIVIGTSLTVHPFASLARIVPAGCTRFVLCCLRVKPTPDGALHNRVLINQDKVGDFGSREDDIIILGRCDDIVRDLAKELGWAEELEKEWAATADTVEPKAAEAKVRVPEKVVTKADDDLEKERLKAEVDKITNELEKSLAISEEPAEEERKEDAPHPVHERLGPAMSGIASRQQASRETETGSTEVRAEEAPVKDDVESADAEEKLDIKDPKGQPKEEGL